MKSLQTQTQSNNDISLTSQNQSYLKTEENISSENKEINNNLNINNLMIWTKMEKSYSDDTFDFSFNGKSHFGPRLTDVEEDEDEEDVSEEDINQDPAMQCAPTSTKWICKEINNYGNPWADQIADIIK